MTFHLFQDAKPVKRKQQRQRHTWLPNEDRAITEFFSQEIRDVRATGNKGSLQSKCLRILN